MKNSLESYYYNHYLYQSFYPFRLAQCEELGAIKDQTKPNLSVKVQVE